MIVVALPQKRRGEALYKMQASGSASRCRKQIAVSLVKTGLNSAFPQRNSRALSAFPALRVVLGPADQIKKPPVEYH